MNYILKKTVPFVRDSGKITNHDSVDYSFSVVMFVWMFDVNTIVCGCYNYL